jgi:hypothetical protein
MALMMMFPACGRRGSNIDARLGCGFGLCVRHAPGRRTAGHRAETPAPAADDRGCRRGRLARHRCEPRPARGGSTPAIALMVSRLHAAAVSSSPQATTHSPTTASKFLTDEGLAPPPERARQLFDSASSRAFKLVRRHSPSSTNPASSPPPLAHKSRGSVHVDHPGNVAPGFPGEFSIASTCRR